MKRFLVVGLRSFGRAVAEGLSAARGEVIAVDTDMGRVDAVRDRVAVAAQLESLIDPEHLRAIGAAEVNAAVVAIEEDVGAEILAVAVLKELGVEEIVARADSEREERILKLVGATHVVLVEVEMGKDVARSLLSEKVEKTVSLAEGVSMIYWTADERMVGRALADTELASRWQLTLVGVRPAGAETLELDPPGDYVVREGDVLLLAGADARLTALTK